MVFPVLLVSISQEDDAKFGSTKKDGDGHSGAGRSSKTFPEVPIEFSVWRGKQEPRLIIPLGLGNLEG